jgi:hypothetical protein
LRFAPQPPLALRRSNAELAQDFLDLEFKMESGRPLARFTRFEGPVHLQVEGTIPPSARPEIEALLTRLRSSGIDIHWGKGGRDLSGVITLSFQSADVLHRLDPRAACFVLPNIQSLNEWAAARWTGQLDWGRLRQRVAATIFLPEEAAPQEIRDCLQEERAAIFIPADTSPQEMRDCLHEELAQALGPLNDLYRLPDSVFNDDNFHSLLTGFDLLMLRLHYAPELANGMSREEVAARLPALLARLNPKGERVAPALPQPMPRAWIADIETALQPGPARRAAADRALALARAQGWQDNRLGFALYLRGRLLSQNDPAAARASFTEAARLYADLPDNGVHLAHALMQLAALDLAQGKRAQARAEIAQARPLAEAAQNAALLATLALLEAEILDAEGAPGDAAALRLDSLPAARYGIGSSAKIRARAAEIAAIARQAPAG